MPLLMEMVANINHSVKNLDRLICKEKSYDIIQLKYQLHQNIPLLNKD